MKKKIREKMGSTNVSTARTKKRFFVNRRTRFQPVVNWLSNGFQPVVRSRLCFSSVFPGFSPVCDGSFVRVYVYLYTLVETKTRTYFRQFGSGRLADNVRVR